MEKIKDTVIFVIKKDEVLLFLRDLDIDPRVELCKLPMLIFCKNELNYDHYAEFCGENWDEVIEKYNDVMDKLNRDIFDPIFLRTQKSGLVGEDMVVSANQQICSEINQIKKEYGSFEEYIARLMVGEGG